jgi:hypothetical protein
MSSNDQHTMKHKAVGSGRPTAWSKMEKPSNDEQQHMPGRHSGIYWRAYTTMVASLVAGILLALGHHLFYSSLNGKPVGAAEEVMHWVTRQQFNGTIGCLFAFSVNTFLLVAVTTAYTQISWSAIKGRSTRLDTIDTIFQAATSFWTLFSFKIWWKYPVLLLLALIIW